MVSLLTWGKGPFRDTFVCVGGKGAEKEYGTKCWRVSLRRLGSVTWPQYVVLALLSLLSYWPFPWSVSRPQDSSHSIVMVLNQVIHTAAPQGAWEISQSVFGCHKEVCVWGCDSKPVVRDLDAGWGGAPSLDIHMGTYRVRNYLRT